MKPETAKVEAGTALAPAPGSAAVIVAEGYYRIKEELERLKELCRVIEPWTAHHACNARSVSTPAAEIYEACVLMRRIIYSPNNRQ